MNTWRDSLETLASAGSLDAGAGSLAGLHAARERHQGQFWTPLAIVELMWRIAGEAFSTKGERPIRLLDNSLGSARMFAFASPGEFELGGFDVDAAKVEACRDAAKAAGFEFDFEVAGMQEANPSGFDVALINPPFSLHLDSPSLQPFDCTTYGSFGPSTAAQSDEYALYQALQAARVVLAVVPASLAESCIEDERFAGARVRLRAAVDLGAAAFKSEGAEVTTTVLVFGAEAGDFLGRFQPQTLPSRLGLRLTDSIGRRRLGISCVEDSAPAVTLPVTGDQTVRVVHSGRKIGLRFKCGLVQARVLNAIYRERVFPTEENPIPRSVKYAGQGMLDVQVMLATDDPMGALNDLAKVISDAGGMPDVDWSLSGYLRRKARQKPRVLAPFGHTIYQKSFMDKVEARTVKELALEPKSWLSPIFKVGETATLHRNDGCWVVAKGGKSRSLAHEDAARHFDMPTATEGWVEIHPPLQKLFPEIAHSIEARAKALGIDKIASWDFQLADAIEIAMKPGGACAAWQQALGKARLAVCLILLKGIKHGLVAMPASLLQEFANRMRSAGISEDKWQIIESIKDCDNLRQINLISLTRLRMTAPGTNSKMYARRLRNRLGMVVVDEGEILANTGSEQTRAVWQLSAGCRIVMTGTPIGNYPRNLQPILAFTNGDGEIGQPFGLHHPYLEANHAKSMAYARKGVHEFAAQHITLEWVTKAFEDSLQDGAKREVPRIKNLAGYRTWLSSCVKRRIHGEPEVAKFVNVPVPTRTTTTVPWDEAHLSHYLTQAEDFAKWYTNMPPDVRSANLFMILVRIGAVLRACNIPQDQEKISLTWRGGLTSKQRYTIDRIETLTQQGRKVLMFASTPAMLQVIGRELAKRGIESVEFSGDVDRAKRVRALDERFRYGPCNVLLATYGVLRAGFDVYQADYVLLPERSWQSTVEEQAIFRVLRPQQTKQVHVEYVHIEGSIDEYQAQVSEFKQAAACAALDHAEPVDDGREFVHMDMIFARFVKNLALLRGVDEQTLRKELLIEAA